MTSMNGSFEPRGFVVSECKSCTADASLWEQSLSQVITGRMANQRQDEALRAYGDRYDPLASWGPGEDT